MNADDIRGKIIEAVSKNGGHLSSSLGAVEISIALAKVFDPQKDRIIWDVGHQAYAWKILTGRADKFDTLRKFNGISGFPNPAESKCDAAIAGHAGVALSVAEGYAAARDILGTDEHIVAVVGDASLVNGTCLEAINNCRGATKKVILVLNDNGMSISKPTGSFSRFLGRLISGVKYNRAKAATEKAGHFLRLSFLHRIYHNVESRVKSLFLGNKFFEHFGLRYIGPIDGHNLKALESAFTVAKEDKRSIIVHVVTKKGKGFEPAEKNPTYWHGVAPFDIKDCNANIPASKGNPKNTWSDTFADILMQKASSDSKIVALTAGMSEGTGLAAFAKQYGSRFYDVGIAEGHLVSFAAGLASGGLKPVVAIYSTFLQRAIDQIMHDVCIAKLPVIFCVDRAGAVGSDGVTHQGLYDMAMLRSLPNLTICQPSDAVDFERLFDAALKRNGPTVIRYPRGTPLNNVKAQINIDIKDASVAIFATGDCMQKAYDVASRVNGVVYFARYIKPFDDAKLKECRALGLPIVSIENGSIIGGLGDTIAADYKFGWPDEFIVHGSIDELEKAYNFDVDSISNTILSKTKK